MSGHDRPPGLPIDLHLLHCRSLPLSHLSLGQVIECVAHTSDLSRCLRPVVEARAARGVRASEGDEVTLLAADSTLPEPAILANEVVWLCWVLARYFSLNAAAKANRSLELVCYSHDHRITHRGQYVAMEEKERREKKRRSGYILGWSVEPTVGIEPTTCCLRNSCSTSELRWLVRGPESASALGGRLGLGSGSFQFYETTSRNGTLSRMLPAPTWFSGR